MTRRDKRDGAQGVSAAGPFTVRELTFQRMVIETIKYLEIKNRDEDEYVKTIATQRGVVRGMSIAFTKMFGNGYQPFWNQQVKAHEKLATTIAKEWMDYVLVFGGNVRRSPTQERQWWIDQRLGEQLDAIIAIDQRY